MTAVTDGLHELSRAIGELQAKVQSLENRVRDDGKDAGTNRQAIRVEISALSAAVARLIDEVREIAPLAEDYRDKRSQAKGVARLLKVLWTIGAAIALAVGTAIGWLMSHLKITIPIIIVMLLLAGAAFRQAM